MNIKFEYLYRDAGNNKKRGDVVFSNNENIELDAMENQLRHALIDGEFFVAEKSFLPKIGFNVRTELDHDWYEFENVSLTSDEVNDVLVRDITDFVLTLKESCTI